MPEPISTTTNAIVAAVSKPAVGVAAGATVATSSLLEWIGHVSPYITFVGLVLGTTIAAIHFVFLIRKIVKKRWDDINA